MKLPESKFKLTLLTTVAAFLVAVMICQLFEWMGFPEQDQVKVFKDMATNFFRSFQGDVKELSFLGAVKRHFNFICTIPLTVLVAPLLEELIFRGALYRLPTKLASGPLTSEKFTASASLAFAVLSSALFSFAHYVAFESLLAGRGFVLRPISNAFLALAFLGFVWCWLYHRTKSIWCNMLSHALFNVTNLVLALMS